MEWYEHLMGIVAMIHCFVGIPLGLIGVACVIGSESRKGEGECE